MQILTSKQKSDPIAFDLSETEKKTRSKKTPKTHIKLLYRIWKKITSNISKFTVFSWMDLKEMPT